MRLLSHPPSKNARDAILLIAGAAALAWLLVPKAYIEPKREPVALAKIVARSSVVVATPVKIHWLRSSKPGESAVEVPSFPQSSGNALIEATIGKVAKCQASCPDTGRIFISPEDLHGNVDAIALLLGKQAVFIVREATYDQKTKEQFYTAAYAQEWIVVTEDRRSIQPVAQLEEILALAAPSRP